MPALCSSAVPLFPRSAFAQPPGFCLPACPVPQRFLPSLTRLQTQLTRLSLALGEPLLVVSGYHSPAYHRARRGGVVSEHLKGSAADVVSATLSPPSLATLIASLCSRGYLRLGGVGLYPHYVHVDVRPGTLRTWTGCKCQC